MNLEDTLENLFCINVWTQIASIFSFEEKYMTLDENWKAFMDTLWARKKKCFNWQMLQQSWGIKLRMAKRVWETKKSNREET